MRNEISIAYLRHESRSVRVRANKASEKERSEKYVFRVYWNEPQSRRKLWEILYSYSSVKSLSICPFRMRHSLNRILSSSYGICGRNAVELTFSQETTETATTD